MIETLLTIGLICLILIALGEFGIFAILIPLGISLAIRLVVFIIDLVNGNPIGSHNSGDEDSMEEDDDEEETDRKKWGYRKAGYIDLKSSGGMRSCRKCKHYSTAHCYIQGDEVAPTHICLWYEEE